MSATSTSSFSAEVATATGTLTLDLPHKPDTVLQLKQLLGLEAQKTAQLVFVGGKRLKDQDPVPFDAAGRVKCRVFGGVVVARQQFDRSGQHGDNEIDSKQLRVEESLMNDEANQVATPTASLQLSGSNFVSIKGLTANSAEEVRLPIVEGMTFLDVKRAFVQSGKCIVSDVRGIKFLGKGGKSPADSDLIPMIGSTVLRALRSERGHDEITSRVEVSEVAQRITEAEKLVPQILNRLLDPESCILETRRIRDEMEDAVRWLDGRSSELEKRAKEVVRKLER